LVAPVEPDEYNEKQGSSQVDIGPTNESELFASISATEAHPSKDSDPVTIRVYNVGTLPRNSLNVGTKLGSILSSENHSLSQENSELRGSVRAGSLFCILL
jgi:hypothetical protein